MLYIDSLETIKKKLKIDDNGPAQAFMTATVAKAMDKYVPFDTGTLAETVIFNGRPTSNVTENTITYTQPYAEYVYKGISKSGKPLNYSLDKHTYAGPHWDQRMLTAEKDSIIKQIEDYIRR